MRIDPDLFSDNYLVSILPTAILIYRTLIHTGHLHTNAFRLHMQHCTGIGMGIL